MTTTTTAGAGNKDTGNNDEVSSSAESDEDFGWVSYFLALKGNEFFCEIDEEYIADNFNLTGLANQVPYYEYALDLITDVDHDRGDLSEEHQELVENDAGILYGLIHARYILTNRGLHAMLEKYRQHGFGTCPRYHCNSQAVLPCGITDQKGKASVKLFCPRCEEIYRPPSARHENIDGACFGTTFPHLFFLVFPELKPEKTKEHYVPRAFGFKLHRTWHQRSLEAAQQASQESLQEQEKRKLEILARKNAAATGGGGEEQPTIANANDSNDSDNVATQQQHTKG